MRFHNGGRHLAAHLALFGVRLIRHIFADGLSIGVAVHVQVVADDEFCAVGRHRVENGFLHGWEFFGPLMIKRLRALIHGCRAPGHFDIVLRVIGVALDDLDSLRQPRIGLARVADDAHLFAHFDQFARCPFAESACAEYYVKFRHDDFLLMGCLL